MINKKQQQALQNIITPMMQPLRDIPLWVVIEGLTGRKVLPFDPTDPKDKKVLKVLSKAARLTMASVNSTGIIRPRPNEVGNDIEPYVKRALNSLGYKADTPIAPSGTKRITGYPDIEFVDEFGRTNYLECKTFNIDNVSTTQRSFYLSPSDDFKVTKDAHHFVISFEIYLDGRQGTKNIYKCQSWKIVDVYNLLLDVKYEFNSDNRRMYSKDLVLGEG